MSSTAEYIAIALDGKRNGSGYMVYCPCHDDHTPSLSIRDGGNGKLLVHCFAGCDGTDVLAELRRLRLLDGYENKGTRNSRKHAAYSSSDDAERKRLERARIIWRSSTSLNVKTPHDRASEQQIERSKVAHLHTWPAHVYLKTHRGITPPFPEALRGRNIVHNERGLLMEPELVAALQDLKGNLCAVQVTTLDGETFAKAKIKTPRKTFGKMGGAACQLAPAGKTLGLAEGLEDALSAMELTGIPTWAACGAGRLHQIAIPPIVRELIIFADNDKPGQEAANKAADHFSERGLRVRILIPIDEKDCNDVIRKLKDDAEHRHVRRA